MIKLFKKISQRKGEIKSEERKKECVVDISLARLSTLFFDVVPGTSRLMLWDL